MNKSVVAITDVVLITSRITTIIEKVVSDDGDLSWSHVVEVLDLRTIEGTDIKSGRKTTYAKTELSHDEAYSRHSRLILRATRDHIYRQNEIIEDDSYDDAKEVRDSLSKYDILSNTVGEPTEPEDPIDPGEAE